MALELAPDPGDRGEPDVRLGRSGDSAVGEHRRLLDSGVQVLTVGALACPRCALPISPSPRIRPRAVLRCAFCDHIAEAVDFLHPGPRDTAANEVALIARLR